MKLNDSQLPNGGQTDDSLLDTAEVSQQQLDAIWTWNAVVPKPVEACVHDLIARRVLENPEAPAICAWDGNLTYGQLDELSTRLAFQLEEKGVALGTIVPLCFEKSMWMSVAALAVMKAGAASVAMDTTQPEERLYEIASQTSSRLILSSVENQDMARRLGACDVIVVDQACSTNHSEQSREQPKASPSDLLYVVFTSGSTGKPKGALITHQNLCSHVKYQQELLGFTRSSRVFDFASYAFDLAWFNLLHTLTIGACLCVPSALERQNHLSECFQKYQVTFSHLTPSVARCLDSKALSRLSVLVLAGEAVLPSDASLVSSTTQIRNAYGPAECTPVTTIEEHTSASNVGIGRGAGVCTWVVKADDPNALAPIGTVGELWIEGPLVGQGYLNDPDKTVAAFTESPQWLLRGTARRTGRHGRLYRTGDLVRYNKDGSLVFVGRKDTQVKIRGQRVELGDVEYHVRKALEVRGVKNVQVTAETIQPQEAATASAILVAFVTIDGTDDLAGDEHSNAVRQATAGLSDCLAELLPAFMLPSAYIPLQNIPMTATGKTDRRTIRTIGVSSWLSHRGPSEENDGEQGEAATEMENLLQEIWMLVLNLPADEVSVNQTFMKLGGDSITAMQVVSQCRRRGVSVTVGDVLHEKTIRRLALRCRSIPRQNQLPIHELEEKTGPVILSPIQQMYFDMNPNGINYFNQCSVLELKRAVSTIALKDALQAVVSRHAMLRARYHQDTAEGRWQQTIAEDRPESFAFTQTAVATWAEIDSAIQHRQKGLDIRQGPVFAADVYRTASDKQFLVLTAHHLVIDLVSWRILWSDIEEHVKFGSLRSQKTISFRTWSRLQSEMARNLSPASVLPHSVPKADLDFWGTQLSSNTYAGTDEHVETLDRHISALLLGDGNDSLRTEPTDMLLGALAYSFRQAFPERRIPTVFVEGHGREKLDSMSIDLSGTVGWFTTMQPLPIPVTSNSTIVDAVRLAKDMRRKIPNKGLSYFACRYHSPAGRIEFEGHDAMEVLFNFTGRYQQLEGKDLLFTRAKNFDDGRELTDITEPARDTTRRLALIEIEASVTDGRLVISFRFHRDMKHQSRLKQWFQAFAQTLGTCTQTLLSMPASLTLTDLPLLPLSCRGLHILLNERLPSMGIKPDNVVDILPCSPMQEGILLSSNKGTASYANYWIWRCVPTDARSTVSPHKLEAAWRTVLTRHPILSTVFGAHPEDTGFIQIILSAPRTRLSHMTSASPTAALCALKRPDFETDEPHHAFTICQAASGDVACRLDISHSLMDASSVDVLVQDIMRAYSGEAGQAAPAFGELVQYIESQPKAEMLASWTSFLAGIEACQFPSSPNQVSVTKDLQDCIVLPVPSTAGIVDFCKDLGITRSVFLQVAWAMVVAQFTGMNEVCFGYLASGRDAQMDGIDLMVGPLANVLIGRIDLDDSLGKVLDTTSRRSIEHLGIQHVSLAEIQHELGLSGKRLFNTAITIREADRLTTAEKTSLIKFEQVETQDPHEFDLTLDGFLDGDKTDISVLFRTAIITRRTAQEVCLALVGAIEHILTAHDRTRQPLEDLRNGERLCNGLFQHLVGTGESLAHSFWEAQFAGQEGTHFPLAKKATYSPKVNGEINLTVSGLEWTSRSYNEATIVRAAWSAVTARSAGANEALFGATVASKGANGLAAPLVPIRVQLVWDKSANCLLEAVQNQATEMNQFERTGLQWIRRVSEEAAWACDFQTLLVVRNTEDTHDSSNALQDDDRHDWSAYAILAECQIKKDGVRLRIGFDSDVIEESQVWRFARQFDHVLHQLSDSGQGEEKLRDVAGVGERDLEDIWNWNSVVPELVEMRMHDLIGKRVQERPEAPAVCAWDGDLTYRELDELSTKLAHQLIQKGVKPGVLVPLCFEKSMWMPVAALAVMKAGGACVSYDSSQPEERLRSITAQAEPVVIVSSVTNESLSRSLGSCDVVVVGREELSGQDSAFDDQLPVVSPSGLLYIVFTSGSTGKPKGVMITHQSFVSGIVHQQEGMGLHKDSRVFDFASYAFDMSWANILNTLSSGGCLCVPSAAERQNQLSECIEKYGITIWYLTPSLARLIDQKILAKTSTLLLGGEAALPSDINLAGGSENTRIVNSYGPAECSCITSYENLNQANVSIGRGIGLLTWLVEVDDVEALAPIGAIGELWLEGPLVGRGYLKDPEKTAAHFVDNPSWLLRGAPGQGHPGRRGRLYRTGDLVRYNEDGSLSFIGRKDTQVKVRGQRVELGEVEHHVQIVLEESDENLKGCVKVVADTICPQEAANAILVAFVALEGVGNVTEEEHSRIVRKATAGLTDRLAQALPAYMVPTAFIPIQDVPITINGKTDRKRLHSIGAALSATELAELSRSDGGDRRAPQTESERLMQALWAEVLHVHPDNIGADDSFFRIGGDSISAMRLVSKARDRDLSFDVREVFHNPVLHNLASLASFSQAASMQSDISPFSLLAPEVDVAEARAYVARGCNVQESQVVDILPCTPLQEGLLALSARQSGEYMGRFVFEIKEEINLEKLREAWNQVVHKTPILRTRIVSVPNQGIAQVVLDESVEWRLDTEIDKLQDHHAYSAGLGTPLTAFSIIEVTAEPTRYFVLEIHHALYDGWSIPLLLDQVEKIYFNERSKPLEPMNAFIEYITHRDDSATSTFWKAHFAGIEGSHFPPSKATTYYPHIDGEVRQRVQGLGWRRCDFTPAMIVRAAWSVIAARSAGSNEALFGVTVTGRQVAVDGIERMAGPAIATVPVRVPLDWESSVNDLLQAVQRQAVEMIQFEQTGLQQIRRVSEETACGCDFQTLLVVQPADGGRDLSNRLMKDCAKDADMDVGAKYWQGFGSYPLMVECEVDTDSVCLRMGFDSAVISEAQARRLAHQFDHMLHQLSDASRVDESLWDVSGVGQRDLDEIWAWNARVPKPVEACIHDLIANRIQEQPDAQAICAWDGDLTYSQLDRLSARLAYQLRHVQGVKPGVIVPLCFEKSMWMPVAALAVMKAGGASVAMDPAQPKERLQAIVTQVKPRVILTSTANEGLARQLVDCHVVVVSETNIQEVGSESEARQQTANPSDLLHVVFTSGSTGTPKGAMITHRNFVSAITHQQRALGFTSSSRVFDFASYAFDMAWFNLLHTLTVGGCLCIPSAAERENNVAECLSKYRVTYTMFTPSVARFIGSHALSKLSTLLLGGEPALPSDTLLAGETTVVKNPYGPAECTPISTFEDLNGGTVRIGHGVGVCTWIVDPQKNTLVPVGSIGELWLEGPIVGPGYLDEPEKTAAAFVHDPEWLLRGASGQPGRHGRLYRTGDLVRYSDDGSLIFVGRKDTQVKIRGQRVELDEVEHHVREALEATKTGRNVRVVAETIRPQGAAGAILVIFMSMDGHLTEEEHSSAVQHATLGLSDRLTEALPVYMVPIAYIPIQTMPLTTTSKTDRRRLKAIGASLTATEFASLSRSSVSRRAPQTETERLMQTMWANVLHIDPESIGAEDNFFRIGGDSISAMRLVSAAKDQGLYFTVRDVFENPVLHALSASAGSENLTPAQLIAPFSLLAPEVNKAEARAHAAHICRIQESQVVDILPCTPLQEGLISLTTRRSGDYVARFIYAVQSDVDIDRLHGAWDQVVSINPILRTRIVNIPTQGLAQVVLDDTLQWVIGMDLGQVLDDRDQRPIGLGTPLTTCVIVDAERRYLVWEIHHALYDGWSIPLLLEQVEKAYYGQTIQPLESMNAFINYIIDREEKSTKAFWQAQFANLECSHFPSPQSATYYPRIDMEVRLSVEGLEWGQGDATAATIIRAAWSVITAWGTGSDEALFGATVTGRQAAVDGIERMAGPAIATIPLRISLDWEDTADHLLQRVQNQAAEMIPFEQTGLQYIRRVSEEASTACNFQALLVVQPAEDMGSRSGKLFVHTPEEEEENTKVLQGFATYAVTVECQVERNGVNLRITFDSSVIGQPQIKRIAQQFGHTLRQLSNRQLGQTRLRDVVAIGQRDLDDIWTWNATVPEPVEECIHPMIARKAQQQPDAPAIRSWDGELAYRQLDDLSTKLAHKLVDMGVRSGTVVPLCFEKSMWMAVAALGVMKSGAISIAMDVSQPEERLRSIVSQVNPKVILSSVANRHLSHRLGTCGVLTVGCEQLSGPASRSELPAVRPSDVLYINFTSGSTGTPKGAMVTHGNFGSAIKYQQTRLGFKSKAQVLDFASYAFDMAWFTLLHTLTVGGCLCVPSTEERQNSLSWCFERYNITMAILTPSVARLIEPKALARVSTMLIAGEAALPSDALLAGDKTQVINAYGPVECTPCSTCATLDGVSASIGRGYGVCTWVVDPENPDVLAPIGTVGELWVEGPLVGKGYLNDPERTRNAFIEDPPWLLRGARGHLGRGGRLYRTGDLVRYNEDGSLVFIGRKDTQVKIRGQRVELVEVEHHIQQSLEAAKNKNGIITIQVTAETIRPQDATGTILVAFVTLDGAAEMSEEEHGKAVRDAVAGLTDRLARRVPVYMVPAAFIPVQTIPMTATGKIDRRRLRVLGDSLTATEFAELSRRHEGGRQRQPETDTERLIQKLWAEILRIDEETISASDSFFRIGGDSIGAMHLAGLAAKSQLQLGVAQIFKHPTLEAMAQTVDVSSEPETEHRRLLSGSSDSAQRRSIEEYDMPDLPQSLAKQVAKVYPLTQTQHQYIEFDLRVPHTSWNHLYLDFPAFSNIGHLSDCCSKLVAHFEILRTIFARSSTGLVQVMLRSMEPEVDVDESSDDMETLFQRAIDKDLERKCNFEESTVRFIILRAAGGATRLVFRLSHTLYDGIGVPYMIEALTAFYNGQTPPEDVGFSAYVDRMLEITDESELYWQSMLQGARMTRSPGPKPSHVGSKHPILIDVSTCPIAAKGDVTPATIFTSAFAVALGRLTGESNLLFGRLVSGRASLSRELQSVAGPCISHVPVKVQLQPEWGINDIVTLVHSQYIDALPYEMMGMKSAAPRYSFVTQYQNIEELPEVKVIGETNRVKMYERWNRDIDWETISVLATPRGDRLDLLVIASQAYHERETIMKLCMELQSILEEYGRS